MHPVARVFQILFLLGGIGMFAYALSDADQGRRNNISFRWECTTVNTGTAERPQPRENCHSRDAWIYQGKTDEVLVSSLVGVGLMIGAGAISVGGARRSGSGGAAAPAPVAQPYGGQYPAQPPQTPPGPPRAY